MDYVGGRSKKLKNEQGNMAVEAAALVIVFVLLISFSFGSFGVIHTSIVNSIHARAYAFETIRNRANVTVFRDQSRIPNGESNLKLAFFTRVGFRAHGIVSEKKEKGNDTWVVTQRHINSIRSDGKSGSGLLVPEVRKADQSFHLYEIQKEIANPMAEKRSVNPVWIKTIYGICLNSECKGAP